MISTFDAFSHFHKEFSVSDTQIDTIICTDNIVRFVFTDGFYVIVDNDIKKLSKGHIELHECNADEFFCYIIQRKATTAGAELRGKPVSLADLAELLDVDHRKIEIFLELYNQNYLYWRGVLLPLNKDGLSDHIVIETAGRFPLMVCGEIDSST